MPKKKAPPKKKLSELSGDELLTTEQAAEHLQLKPNTLEVWRWERPHAGPPFIRISRRCVRYRRPDLDAWLEANTRGGTAAA